MTMILSEYIETLRALPQDIEAAYRGIYVPVGKLTSWRGAYAELTIPYADDGPHTIAQLLKDAEAAVGRMFTGYKGGEYIMTANTPVWADDYGSCHYNVPTGFSIHEGAAQLHTTNIREYQ